MSVTTVAWSMVAAACMTLAIVLAMTWLLRTRSSSCLFSSITALAAAGNAFTELVMLRAESVEIYVRAMKWEVFFAGILLIGLTWFVKVYFDTARHWLAVVITVSWTFLLIINVFSPVSLVFSEITSLNEGSLPWGEHFVYATGTANPWNLPANVLPVIMATRL
jgi:hypothetical protein